MDKPVETFHPVRQRTLLFQGTAILTADLRDGQGYVAINSLCDAFGLDRRGQRQRLMRQQSYFAPYTATLMLETSGGAQATLCLAASAVPLFLSGVQLERVKDAAARALLTAFLDEAHVVLAEHFGISERGEIRFLRETVARMTAEQEAFEGVISKKVEAELAAQRQAHEEKIAQIREAFAGLRQQVRTLEEVAGPKARLSPEQLGQIRQSVAVLGALLQERGEAKPYPGIYMDITRLSGVSRSEDIRQEDFGEVVAFLDRQIAALTKKAES